MKKQEVIYTKCPFCKTERKDASQKTCKICGLNFDEVKEASNKQAKKRMLSRKPFESLEDEIVYTNIPPKDIDVPTLKTLTYLLGLFGANNIYTGKFFRGFAMLLLSTVALIFTIVNYVTKVDLYLTISYITFIIPLISWLVDIIMVSTKTYTMPVKLLTYIDVEKFYNYNRIKKAK